MSSYFNNPTFLILNQIGQLIKDANFFSCTESESNKHLTVSITVEKEVFFKQVFFNCHY